MVYQHPLGYLIAMEGMALIRAWAGDDDYDERFVRARIEETRRLLADPALNAHPGVQVERDATAAAYEQWAARYDDPGNGLFDLDEPVIEEILDGLVGSPQRRTEAVDVACGTGRLTARLVARGYSVTGIDASPAMLDVARGRRLPGADFLEGSFADLPVATDSADLAVCGLALTHVVDLRPAFAEFARVLRPGGQLVISDAHHDLVLLGSAPIAAGPNGEPMLSTTVRHPATAYLRAALATGFSVRRCEERPEPTAPSGPLPEPTTELGAWPDWPWSLLGVVPEAVRAAWNSPAVIVWHFELA